MSETIFLSTTIPYVNGLPHVGHAQEFVQADVAARYHRLRGRRVVFQSGTDENSLKNVLAARSLGRSVRDHVDELATTFRNLLEELDVSIDLFVRTGSSPHATSVTEFWRALNPLDLSRRSYSGIYCVGCEDFWKPEDLIDGLCPDHRTAPGTVAEENVFFALSEYGGVVAELIRTDRLRITPPSRKTEILNFIESGLRDISISRDRARAGDWGIPLPDDPNQIVYVWIDALINYVTGSNFGSPEFATSPWIRAERRIHFVGKNVWKFHAVYWPALLLSAKLPLPDEIVIHGFLTQDGAKISKSLGNAIDPSILVKKFGSDSFRFYVLRCLSPFHDGDFSEAALREAHNTFLVGGLGNLVSRLSALAVRANASENSACAETQDRPAPQDRPELFAAIESSRFDEALKLLWRDVDRINKEIAQEKPWEQIVTDPSAVKFVLTRWTSELLETLHWLSAFLPSTARRASELLRRPTAGTHHLFERI